MNSPREIANSESISADHLIGNILVNTGRLSVRERDDILNFQKEHELLFCEAGLHLGLLDRADIRFALAEQIGHGGVSEVPVTSEVVAVRREENPCIEAIRTLRSQLMLRWIDKATEPRKCLAIVSVEERVGRSFIVANLAALFAQLGQRSLLVDANLRNPRVHRIFSLDNSTGLSSVLAGNPARGAIVHINAVAGLSVLPAGPIPSNPQELLSGQRFRHLIEAATSDYDVVLFDTPAWKCGADAQLIASRAGAAILVSRPAKSLAQPTLTMVDMLAQSGAQVLGAVMNAF